MKYFVNWILLSIVCFNYAIQAQIVFHAPEFKFSGTPVQWHHRPKEVNIDKQVGYILKLEQFNLIKKPILIDDRVFFLLDNAAREAAEGSTLICYDHQTGDSLWQNNYNQNFYGKGFSFLWDFREVSTGLELFGYAIIDTLLRGVKRPYIGFSSRVIVDKDGRDLYIQVNREVSGGVPYIATSPPMYLEGSDFALYYGLSFPLDTQTATNGIHPSIWDINLNVRKIPENNIWFKEKEQSFSTPLNGPVQIDALTYVYFYSMYFNSSRTFKHYMFKTNPYGKYFDLREVTSILGNQNQIFDLENSGGLIRLKLNSPYLNKFPGNAGYLYLDENMDVVKDQRAWKIEGRPVGHVISVDLKDSSEILHVVRFVDDNNLFFYKEKSNGDIYPCGKLVSENSKQFVFLPRYILQTNERDVILTLNGVLDSVVIGQNFVLGGWPYICKIRGRDLSIVSNSETISTTNFSISPNPVEDMVKIVVPESNQESEMKVMNSMGQTVFEAKLCEFENEFSLAYLPSGLYSILIKEGNLVMMSKKILKL